MISDFGLRISERMAGFLIFTEKPVDASLLNEHFEVNKKYPFDFSIHAFSPFPFKYPVQHQFEGECHLPGFPNDYNLPEQIKRPKTAGKLQISHKGVAYDFETEIPGHGKVRIFGAKTYVWDSLSWPRIRTGLTFLPVKIERDGKIIGSGELKYLSPLWEFPFGLRICKKEFAHRPDLKPAKKVFPLVTVLYPDYYQLGSDEEILNSLQEQFKITPWPARKLMEISNLFVKFLCAVRFGKRIGRLDLNERISFCKILQSNIFAKLLAIPLIVTILHTVFGQKEFLRKKGQNIITPPKTFEPEPWMSLLQGPNGDLGHEPFEVDVVVVGSGAGGAALASSLSQKGLAVAIVEEGHYFKRQDLTGLSASMIRKLYQQNGVNFSLSNVPLWIPTGKCVGGTTFINSGTCIKTPPELLEKWRQSSGDSKLDLEPYFPIVERELGFNRVPKEIIGGISNVLERGLEGTNYKYGPLKRAEMGCDGQSYCVIGCPTNAKRSTAVSFIPEALKRNAFLFSPFQAKKVLFEGKSAVGLQCGVEGFGQEFDITFKAKFVVIAAGTFKTPWLLHKSGVTKKMLPALGENLTIHPALTVGGMFNRPVRETLFVPQSMGIFELGHPNYICEGYTLPVDVVASAMGQWGAELKEIMDRISHVTNFSSMMKDVVKGKVVLTPWGPLPSYFVNRQAVEIMKDSAVFLSKIFLKGGAEKIYVPIHGHNIVKSEDDIRLLEQAHVSSQHFMLSAHHPLGSCQMGSRSGSSVVDWDGRVHGLDGLYICDGSAIPGPLGVNPQVTIMANALRIADKIMERLG